MKTTKPLSTISYNSFNWLMGTLDRLLENGIIRFYAVIGHKPEEDENKAHYHVYVEPAKQLDDNWLQSQFVEPVAGDKPLKSLPSTSRNLLIGTGMDCMTLPIWHRSNKQGNTIIQRTITLFRTWIISMNL